MKSNVIVVYKSTTGFTRQYAQAIAKALGGEAVSLKNAGDLAGARVIYGGRIIAGGVDGWKQFQKRCPRPAALFAVGALPADLEDTVKAVWKQNLTEAELAAIPHFYFQGGLRYDKMPLGEKLMMKAFAAMLAKKKDKSTYDQQAAAVMGHSYDCYNAAAIAPLVDTVQSL
ncbi:MAG: flavodoxin domain-containing protein [Eubacteriales bacterium]|nr:flavodoxin domain-containing protein [Eubacteriales bacterium]